MQYNLVNGHYTTVFSNGNHATFKISVAENGGIAGKRIISIFNGCNNDELYTAFAFVKFWGNFNNKSKQFSDKDEDFFMKVKDGVKILKSNSLSAGKEYGMRSGKCCVCETELTTPNSIKAGIGPICSRKFLR